MSPTKPGRFPKSANAGIARRERHCSRTKELSHSDPIPVLLRNGRAIQAGFDQRDKTPHSIRARLISLRWRRRAISEPQAPGREARPILSASAARLPKASRWT
jgi:hypothetical protein